MRCRIVFFLFLLPLVPHWVLAKNAPDKNATPLIAPTKPKQESTPKEETKSGCYPTELSVMGKNDGKETLDFRFKMGESLGIKARGDCAARIKKELADDPSLKGVRFYLNGVPMANLPSTLLQNQNEKELLLSFDLIREANNEDNRKAWDRFFIKSEGYLMKIQPALALGNDPPRMVLSPRPLQFYVASGSAIGLTLITGLMILLVSFYLLVTKTDMLRDEGTRYYSLGKSQMAFWGLLVFLSFSALWILTGSMERIPPQTLILLGISGATALSAILIGNGKKSEIQNRIAQLRKQDQELLEKEAPGTVSLSEADKNRLTEIRKQRETLSKQLKPGESEGFWKDICDDGNGISFHRLQVVLWTLVLGFIFIRSVAQGMSMPEFSETLLILMGISNGTYVGFKIPEKL